MRKFLVCVLFAAACSGGEDNNGSTSNNVVTNGSTNVASNNSTSPNNVTNGSTNSPTNNATTSPTNNSTANPTNNSTSSTNNSTNSTNNSTSSTNGNDVSALEDAIWDALCEAIFQCPNRSTAALNYVVGGRYGTEQACKAATYRAFDTGQLRLAVEEGRLDFDPANLAACQAAFREAFCSVSGEDNTEAACAGILVGLVADGDNCTADDECAVGECGIPDDQCYGTCGAPMNCGVLNCDLATEYCGPAQTCEPRAADGASCMSAECLPDSACLLDVCVPFFSRGDGEPCLGADRDSLCAAGLVCTSGGLCAPEQFAGVGEPCSLTNQGPFCNPGLACLDLFGTPVCGATVQQGGTCDTFFQCAEDLYCEVTCEPRKADGQACVGDEECVSNFCDYDLAMSDGLCGSVTYCAVP